MARSRAALASALAAALAAAGCASDGSPEKVGVATFIQNAEGYSEGGHYDQALAQFRKALEVEPNNRKALFGEMNCLYWLGCDDTPAGGRAILEAEEKAAALDPSDYGDKTWMVDQVKGLIHARLADLWGRKADLAARNAESAQPGAEKAVAEARSSAAKHGAEAERHFRAELACTDEPFARNNLTALFFLASRLSLRAESPEGYEEALGFFRRFEKEVEKSKALWVQMKEKAPDLAETYDRKLKGAEREEIELRDLVANVHFKRREHEASIAELDKVIALDPFRAPAFFNRGRNHEELGRFGAAADDYRRFLRLTDLPSGSALVVEAADRMARCEEKLREKMGE